MKYQRTIGLLLSTIALALLAGCGAPLLDAIKRGDDDSVRTLINQGADVNAPGVTSSNFMSTNPISPLNLAAAWNRKSAIELLIAKGANVNARDGASGNTPLHYAANGGDARKDIVELLLAKGADARITNFAGETPRMLAESSGHLDIAKILRDAETEGPRRVENMKEDPQEIAKFEKAAQEYRNTTVKPVLPEECRRYKVQAETLVRSGKLEEAAVLYGKALDIAPWWPEGHFNRAIVLGETRYYLSAIREMKRYLLLAPDAPNARAAQDKVYEWEGKAGAFAN